MEFLLQILVLLVDDISGHVNVLFAFVSDWSDVLSAGGITAFATMAITYFDIPAKTLSTARRWHGSIKERYDNINNLTVLVEAHTSWKTPPAFSQIAENRKKLSTLIPKCRSVYGSAMDRAQRNTLLKTTVDLCLKEIKIWAYAQYYAGVMTLDDVHTLGFLLPGEAGGHHGRAKATDVLAEVKVSIISADVIRVVIDQAVGENSALTAHGWPHGVRHALIVIISAADGVTEILRRQTTRLYNNIYMPKGSHGKQFVIKASFLRHIDDEPRFGPQPTFSMPLTTEDLVSVINRQHQEKYEANLREIERQREETVDN
jgi:hypothetical protein